MNSRQLTLNTIIFLSMITAPHAMAEPAKAESAAKRALIEKCLTTGKYDETMTSELTLGLQQRIEGFKRRTRELNMDESAKAEQIKFFDGLPKRIIADVKPQSDLHQMFARAFDKYYTQQDLKALSEFYAQQAGGKAIQLLPKLHQQVLERVDATLTPKMNGILDQSIADAQQKGLIPAMPPPPQ